jgi:hypothetical protein
MPKVTSAIPIMFDVIRDDELADVTLNFSDNRDVMSATRWRVPRELENVPGMQVRAADAREFAKLAAKRWKHYRDTSTAAFSLPQLQKMIAADPEGEFCFHLKVTADWFPASLGGAMVRRTWCHHLMIDFLFVHPSISGKTIQVRNVGIQTLRCICLIARELGCDRIWGEATRDSAPFYARQLGQVVKDQFQIDKSQIRRLSSEVLA